MIQIVDVCADIQLLVLNIGIGLLKATLRLPQLLNLIVSRLASVTRQIVNADARDNAAECHHSRNDSCNGSSSYRIGIIKLPLILQEHTLSRERVRGRGARGRDRVVGIDGASWRVRAARDVLRRHVVGWGVDDFSRVRERSRGGGVRVLVVRVDDRGRLVGAAGDVLGRHA